MLTIIYLLGNTLMMILFFLLSITFELLHFICGGVKDSVKLLIKMVTISVVSLVGIFLLANVLESGLSYFGEFIGAFLFIILVLAVIGLLLYYGPVVKYITQMVLLIILSIPNIIENVIATCYSYCYKKYIVFLRKVGTTIRAL